MDYGLWAMAYGPLELNSRGLEAYEATTGVGVSSLFFLDVFHFSNRGRN
jgi:hypothetical protein